MQDQESIAKFEEFAYADKEGVFGISMGLLLCWRNSCSYWTREGKDTCSVWHDSDSPGKYNAKKSPCFNSLARLEEKLI